MDLATVLSVVQTILSAIKTLDQLKATFSFSKYKDEIERLGKTVSIIQSVLEDADAKQGALSRQQTIYIQELKDAIYDANDILDEFVTLVKQKAVIESQNKVSRKVTSFLSHFNLYTRNLSNKVKDVNKKLDDIASNSSKFMFKVDNQPTRFIKPASCSFASENDIIIGRGKELDKVVGMLLTSHNVYQSNNLTSIVIVGMGGLGKTAFAQLIYNDRRVTNTFQLKSWTCIADQDQWNLNEVIGKIVKELPITNTHDISSLERMRLEIKKQLQGKKYLLVLDDVWTESYHKWQDLENILRVGARGSRILVTTRSEKTAKIIGDNRVHELQGLQEEESWRLFEKMAFLPRQRENPDDELVKLGKEIVKKCSNVPLAIRVVASLLRGEPKLKWLSFHDKELANISESDHTLNNILRQSYHQLDFPLKSCFAYCAIFPKDFVIDKETLIKLWMAQGYISNEYMGEEYFLVLVQRCFFQDLGVDEWGETRRFKIHDMLHDFAEQIAGDDICRLSSDDLNVGNKFRHLSLLYDFCPLKTFNKTHLLTCVQINKSGDKVLQDSENTYSDLPKLSTSSSDTFLAGNSLANWTCLRSLDLTYLVAKSLPKSIGELIHLRYLNLSSCTMLDALPNSITKLVNLQTLDLSNCFSLRILPKGTGKLLDLSTLNITNCKKLSHMPSGMGSLTHLHTLGLFVVGQESSKGNGCHNGLEALRSMSNLKGFLELRIGVHDIAKYVEEDHNDGAYLGNKERLKQIHIIFTHRKNGIWESIQGLANKNIEFEHALLEEMQPHHDLRELVLKGYNGELLPKWPRRGNNSALFHLPNLTSLQISDCSLLRCLPSLGELPHLKDLTLESLPNVEYVMNAKPEASELAEGSPLFPCLERLIIAELGKLKWWWPILKSWGQGNNLVVSVPLPCFPQLKELSIRKCPMMLKSFPMCLSLEHASIGNYFQSRLLIDHLHEFNRTTKAFISSDSKSRILSLVGSDFDKESNDIDINLTLKIQLFIPSGIFTYRGPCGA